MSGRCQLSQLIQLQSTSLLQVEVNDVHVVGFLDGFVGCVWGGEVEGLGLSS